MTTARKSKRRPRTQGGGQPVGVWMSPEQRFMGLVLQERTGLSLSHILRKLMQAYHDGLSIPGLPQPPGTPRASTPP